MKIEIDKDHLLKAVIIADSIIPSKSVNALLGNCCFTVSNDNVEIMGTDEEIKVRSCTDVVSDGNISFTCDGKRFSQILKELPKGSVFLDIAENNVIKINSKSEKIKGSYKLIGTSADDFPSMSKIPEGNAIELDQAVLKEMIRKVIYAASHDSVKPVFNGIFFKTEENNLTLVASDSRRLSMISREIKGSINLNDGIIIPLKTINEVYKLLSEGVCYFSVENKQCYFKINDTEIESRLIDGQFPNYKQVIPKDFKSECNLDNKLFIESLRRVMIFTKEPSFKIICNFKKDNLNIEANTPELGEAEENIPIDSSADEEIKLGINAQFIMDSVKEIDSYGLKICLTGPMSPVAFMAENDDNFVSVVMPIQIKNAE